MSADTAQFAVRPQGLRPFLIDCDVLIRRNLTITARTPAMILAIVLQPLMFVLVFSYVFGDALGGDFYRQFLIGGVMAQTVTFNCAFSALGLATDLENGVMDRFRALPMSRLSVVAARCTSDIVINAVGLTVMSLAGLVVGWRIHTTFGEAIVGYLLALAFGFSMSWVGSLLGMVTSSFQATQSLVTIVVFPMCFISSAFIPSRSLPAPLRAVANWNPVTSLARSLREGFGNPISAHTLITEPRTWAALHPQVYTLLCCAVILLLSIPLSMLLFRLRTRGGG
ncbi:ABC transporter permease [Gordonia sp. VNK1]|uniref:ABC transporter permease n=1 Tax=Gordonia oleivorans TaxID=3156618 RepID=UPI0032B4E146